MKKCVFKNVSTKWLSIMKISLFMIFFSTLHLFAAESYSQLTRLTLHMEQVKIKDVLTQIESQSEFSFLYNGKLIDVDKTVSVHADNRSITDVLLHLFDNEDIEFRVVDRQIVLMPVSLQTVNSPSVVVQQQGRRITGTVIDDQGDPIIGANIIEEGTTNGVISDLDGKFALTVPENATLQISFIGFITQEIPVRNQSNITVTLRENLQTLEEVVVVGYGTQQRRNISGSITTVSSEELKEVPVATFAEALQGMAAGIYVMSTGAPGSPTTMRIRGVGSMSSRSASPLIIVDGVQGVDVDAINPNDIENFSILKDASATAIYGARGANGVILITTKQGSRDTGRVRITYDGYYGLSTMANSGYDVLDGWECMEFEALGMINKRDIRGYEPGSHPQFGTLNANDELTMPYSILPAGLSKDDIVRQFGSVDAWVAAYRPNATNAYARSAYYQMLEDGYSEAEARKGTDWYDMVVRTGYIQNHNLSLQGGNGEKGMYSLSLGVQRSEGTLVESFYDRYTLRANLVYNATKYLSIGSNISLAATSMGGDRGGGGEGTIYATTFEIHAWVPPYGLDGVHFAGSQAPGGGARNSSVGSAYAQSLRTNYSYRGQVSVYAELKPIDGLVIKTQYAPSLNGSWTTQFNPYTLYYNKEGAGNNSYSETARYDMTWQWTNTVSYDKTFNMDHTISVTAGSESIDQNRIGRELQASRINYVFENDPNTWTISNGSASGLTNSGSMQTHSTMFGLFGRAEYSYKGTYILNASVRRDASSSFSEKNRWGTFPSISAAWRVSDETFMAPTKKFIDDMKFRIGYGTTGSTVGGSNWAFQYGTGNGHLYSRDGTNTSVWTGYGVTNLGDESAQWETVRTLNIGLDVTALTQRLTASVEWYTRQTSDMLVAANWSALAGSASFPSINIGNMSNKGVDFQIGWRERKRTYSYNISANISTYRNEVKKLGSSDIYGSTRISEINITTVGEPTSMFYGYNVLGIYKSEDDVMNYRNSKGESVVPFGVSDPTDYKAIDWVGRYILEDTDDNGIINALDRKIIGNPHPDFTGGLNGSFNYGNFDLTAQFYFSVGNDLYKMYTYYTHFGALGCTYSRDRRDQSWHPVTNPDGKYPLWLTTSYEGTEAANNSNSMYIEDGSYLRMRNLTLGYSLPRNIVRTLGLERLRVYAQVTNVFTLTKYPGLEPEVRSDGITDMGRDFGAYGQPRQYILGVNISFQ